MLAAVTIHMSIARCWASLYEEFWRPEAFPRWASGLSAGALRWDGDAWRATGPGGPVRLRFTPHNDFGIMDHWVETAEGARIAVPMRVVAHGEGAEILFTLFRQQGMSDADFARDQDWVRRDLARLKALAEAPHP